MVRVVYASLKGWVCVGYVDIMFFGSCYLALGSQHKRTFWWNMNGLKFSQSRAEDELELVEVEEE